MVWYPEVCDALNLSSFPPLKPPGRCRLRAGGRQDQTVPSTFRYEKPGRVVVQLPSSITESTSSHGPFASA